MDPKGQLSGNILTHSIFIDYEAMVQSAISNPAASKSASAEVYQQIFRFIKEAISEENAEKIQKKIKKITSLIENKPEQAVQKTMSLIEKILLNPALLPEKHILAMNLTDLSPQQMELMLKNNLGLLKKFSPQIIEANLSKIPCQYLESKILNKDGIVYMRPSASGLSESQIRAISISKVSEEQLMAIKLQNFSDGQISQWDLSKINKQKLNPLLHTLTATRLRHLNPKTVAAHITEIDAHLYKNLSNSQLKEVDYSQLSESLKRFFFVDQLKEMKGFTPEKLPKTMTPPTSPKVPRSPVQSLKSLFWKK